MTVDGYRRCAWLIAARLMRSLGRRPGDWEVVQEPWREYWPDRYDQLYIKVRTEDEGWKYAYFGTHGARGSDLYKELVDDFLSWGNSERSMFREIWIKASSPEELMLKLEQEEVLD